MENRICKIKIGLEISTGFFCTIPFPDKKNSLPVLITNNHVIDNELLNNKHQVLSIFMKEEKDKKIFDLNNRITYTKRGYGITIIEIKEKDNINYFLEFDDYIINDLLFEENNNYLYEDKTIYIIQYPESELSVSYGILENIYMNEKYNFQHKCCTRKGSSGSPILNINNKLIGIIKKREIIIII